MNKVELICTLSNDETCNGFCFEATYDEQFRILCPYLECHKKEVKESVKVSRYPC